MHRANAGHHAVRRGVLDQVLLRAASALRRNCECAVLGEGASVAEIGDVFARRALPQRVPFGDGFRPVAVQSGRQAQLQSLQVGTLGSLPHNVRHQIGLQRPWIVRKLLR